MTIIKQAIIAELQRQQDADKLNRLIVQPLCGKDCIIRGPVDLDALAVAISAAPPQPAPDALQRILCGIVGTPDANGMVMFKVHESVVRQMQAAGRPAPVQSGVRGDREAIARAICEADGHDYDRELQFAALNADGVGQQFAQNIINRAHRYADAILSIQSTGDQQTPQVTATLPACDACLREVERVRGSPWHGDAAICTECFAQWYDPDNGTFDNCNPIALGNYVRKKHGLPPRPDRKQP